MDFGRDLALCLPLLRVAHNPSVNSPPVSRSSRERRGVDIILVEAIISQREVADAIFYPKRVITHEEKSSTRRSSVDYME
jgi:hypothetical protein